jgi:hypothetical protein
VERIQRDFKALLKEDENSEVFQDRTRSPSPVIIWRPNARVKLATDISPDLRAALLGGESSKQAQANNTTGKQQQQQQQQQKKQRLPRIAPRKKKPVRHIPSSFDYTAPNRQPRPQYGAWYLPTKKWRLRYPKEYEGDEDDSDGDTPRARIKEHHAKRDRELTKRQEKCDAEIPSLYISRAYKSFVRHHRSNTTKMPKYLRNVSEFENGGVGEDL